MNVKAFIYWFIVALPLSWGLYKAIEKSVPLFSDNAPAAPAAKVVPAATTPAPMATPAVVVTPAASPTPAAVVEVTPASPTVAPTPMPTP